MHYIILEPHADDAYLSLNAFIRERLSAGDSAEIATVCRSPNRDSHAYAKTLGIPCTDLNVSDNMYRENIPYKPVFDMKGLEPFRHFAQHAVSSKGLKDKVMDIARAVLAYAAKPDGSSRLNDDQVTLLCCMGVNHVDHICASYAIQHLPGLNPTRVRFYAEYPYSLWPDGMVMATSMKGCCETHSQPNLFKSDEFAALYPTAAEMCPEMQKAQDAGQNPILLFSVRPGGQFPYFAANSAAE